MNACRFDGPQQPLHQSILASLAELLQLRSLTIVGGHLGCEADLACLTSLKALTELKLLPCNGSGITDEQVCALGLGLGLRRL